MKPRLLSTPTPIPTTDMRRRLHSDTRPGDTDARAARPAVALAAARTVLAVVAAVVLLAIPRAASAQDGLPVGTLPEPVVLETLDGDPVDLEALTRGRPALIEFWATWCTVCRALEPELTEAHRVFGEDVTFVVVAAAVAQTRDRVRQHLRRSPAVGQVLWDTRGRFTRAYDAPGTGYVVILDGNGRVAYAGTGPDQDLAAALAPLINDDDEAATVPGDDGEP